MADLDPPLAEFNDGSLDWVVPLYVGFLASRGKKEEALAVVTRYRDNNIDRVMAHEILLGK